MSATLEAIHLAVDDLARATDVYRAIVGVDPLDRDGAVDYAAGHVSIVVRTRGGHEPPGVVAAEIVVEDVDSRAAELAERSVPVSADSSGLRLMLSGIELRVAPASGTDLAATPAIVDVDGPTMGATAEVDHLALRVHDLAEASAVWEAATGAIAHQMGLHPVSGGAFAASRLHLGDQMIELVSPTPGVESAVSQRLDTHGEGPAALAVPSPEIDVTLGALDALGVRVFRHEPHWMVHPADAGGVLVQLTPRVTH